MFLQGRLPVKWMAPEALFDRVYTHQSDVWVELLTLFCQLYFLLCIFCIYVIAVESNKKKMQKNNASSSTQ